MELLSLISVDCIYTVCMQYTSDSYNFQYDAIVRDQRLRGALAKTACICHGTAIVAASCFKSFLGTNTCSVALLASEMDADNICFNEAKEATEQMVLRELQEHVAVGPMPQGAINLTNLPIRE